MKTSHIFFQENIIAEVHFEKGWILQFWQRRVQESSQSSASEPFCENG